MQNFGHFSKIILSALPVFLGTWAISTTGYAQHSPSSIQDLRENLRSTNELDRLQAAARLGDYGPLAASAVPELMRLLDAEDLALRHEAALTLAKIGPSAAPAVPALLKLLDEDSVILKDGALQALRGLGPAAADAAPRVSKLLDSPDEYVRVLAARTMLAIQNELPEDQRKRVIDILLSGLRLESAAIAANAAEGLASLGKDAVPALIAVLQNGPETAIPEAVEALIHIGSAASPAVPELALLTRSEDESVRFAAVVGLGGISAQPKASIEALVPRLSDSSPSVRAAAANAIYRFGPAAATSIDDLRRRLSDEDETVRMAAARALGSLGTAGGDAVGDLLNAINTGTGPVALAAADALASIGKPAVPALTEAIKKPELRGLALAVLERMGPDAEGAIPVLGQIIVGLDEDNAAQAAITIGSIGPAAKSLTPVLVSLMDKGETERVRAASAYALGKIGATEALPSLRKALESRDPLLSLGAAHAIAALAPEDEQAVAAALPRLEEGLKNERPAVRAGVANVLGGLGPAAKDATDSLRSLLDDSDAAVRAEAAGALGRIGANDEETIAALAKSLNDTNPRVRYATLFALGSAGQAASALESIIQEKLDGPDGFESAVAAWALVKITPMRGDLGVATEKLLSILSHPSPAVRIEAATTLAEIAGDDQEVMTALEKALNQEPVPAVQEAMKSAIATAKNNLD